MLHPFNQVNQGIQYFASLNQSSILNHFNLLNPGIQYVASL